MKKPLYKDAYYCNHALLELSKKLQLTILHGGYTILTKGWKGHSVNPVYSRLYYILDGSFTIVLQDGETLTLTKGNFYLLPAGLSFDYECQNFVEKVFFHIQLCNFGNIDLLKKCHKPLIHPLSSDQKASLKELAFSADILNSLKVFQEIYHSISVLLEKYQISLNTPEYSEHVQNALIYINTHLSVQLNIAEVAKHTYSAISTLSRDFKLEVGLPLGKYIDNLVLSRAEHMLLTTNKSILEISEILGFCDQSYFTRQFKTNFGMTPIEYRKRTII